MRKFSLIFIGWFLLSLTATAQTPARAVPRGPTLPPTCATGDLFVKTTAPRGAHICRGVSGKWVLDEVVDAVRDYDADPAGVVDATTAIQSAIDDAAASTPKRKVRLRAGTYKVNTTSLVLKDQTVLYGDGKDITVITSTFNGPIVKVGTTAFNAVIRDLTITGSTAQSSQVGLEVKGTAEYWGFLALNIFIKTTGSHGLFVKDYPFSSTFENIEVTGTRGFHFLVDCPISPNIIFRDCYAHVLDASGPLVGYRIKAGKIRFENCNGLDNWFSGSKWAVVGRKNGVDGDTTNEAAFVEWIGCNMESWYTNAVHHYYNSVSQFQFCTIGTAAPNSSRVPLLYEVDSGLFPAFASKGLIDARTVFTDGPESNYANSSAIHSNDIPPLIVAAQGAAIAGGDALHKYYDTTKTVREHLARADGFFKRERITGTRAFDRPGVRYIEVNHSAAATVTIPWAGWYQVGEYLTVVDVSNNASTNNITVTAGGGGTINGSSSYTISANRGAVMMAPDGDTGVGAWRIIAVYPSGGVAGTGVATRIPYWQDATTLTTVASLDYTAATGTVRSPQRLRADGGTASLPTITGSDTDTGIYFPGANEIEFDTSGVQRLWLTNGNLNAAVNHRPLTANTYDVGNSTDTWRSGYFGTSISTLRIDYPGQSSPGVSAAGTGRIYFDSTANKLKCSENAGAYVDCIGAGGGGISGSIAADQIAFGSAANTIAGDADFKWTNSTNRMDVTGHVFITQQATGTVPFTVQALASSSAELVHIKDSGGSVRGGWATSGAFFFRGFSSPPTNSLADDGKLYYDKAAGSFGQQLYLSKNTAQYNPVIVANQATYTSNRIPLWSSTNWELTDLANFDYQSANAAIRSPGRLWALGGTTALPAFASGNDTDTGMHFPGANEIEFNTNGVQRVWITNGNLNLAVNLRAITDAAYDLGVSGNRFRDLNLSRDVIAAGNIGFSTTINWRSGSGTPESVVTADVGALYSRTNGAAGTAVYVKEVNPGGNTGWYGVATSNGLYATQSGTGAQTIDWAASGPVATRQFTVSSNASVTFTFSNAKSGQVCTLIFIRDATGSAAVNWPAAVKWPGATPITPIAGSAKKDVYQFIYDGTNYQFMAYSADNQ